MADVIIYDKATGEIKEILESVDTSKFAGRDDVLINAKIPPGVEDHHLKIEGGKVVEMTTSEKEEASEAIVMQDLESRKEEVKKVFDISPRDQAIVYWFLAKLNELRALQSLPEITEEEARTELFAKIDTTGSKK